jgi:hypothetical protein
MNKWDTVNREYFLYGHYGKDTNRLFYIGIGKKRKGTLYSQIYSRAYQCSKYSRNFLWLRYYNKHGRIVKILYDNLTEKECKEQEIHLISKFGKIIDKSGILCNISSGGEGRYKDKSNNKKIYVYNLRGNLISAFPSCLDAASFYNLDRRLIGMAANMKRITCGKYQFRYEHNKDVNIRNLSKTPRRTAIPIVCTNLSTGQELPFSSFYKFQKFLGISSNAHILDCLNGKRKAVKGWRVTYSV